MIHTQYRWLWSFALVALLMAMVACQPIQAPTPAGDAPAATAPAEEEAEEEEAEEEEAAEAPMDPAAVMDAYTAAINAGDVEAALALVAEDAVYERPAGQFNGREEVRGFIEGLIARNAVIELIGERTVDGERVTWQSHVTLDDAQNPSGPRVELFNQSESIVSNGLIIHHQATPLQN